MRVISGIAKGRRLKEPKGNAVRPTTDQVKESVFNLIQFQVEGRRVLDLFSGTGQLGIEALSRGAESAVFVDAAADSLKLTEENLLHTGLQGRAKVVRSDALEFLRRRNLFDLIFLDPPYDTKLLDKSLEQIIQFDILRENGIIICEFRADRTLPIFPEPYQVAKDRRYGQIRIAVVVRQRETKGNHNENSSVSGEF